MALFTRSDSDPEPDTDRPPPSGGRRWWVRLIWLLILVLLGVSLAGVLYGLYLDQVVRARFEGKRWALPARVYAQPLELFAGRALTADQLAQELERLGYVKLRQPERAGSYARERDRFLVRTRPFRFWDGAEPSRLLELSFAAGQVERVRQAEGGGELPLTRLDPALIASIYPSHHEDRVLLQREELPDLLVQTLMAVEDRYFYEHHGVSPMAILRAVMRNLRAGRAVQGGSTLTQQLVKNFYLTGARTLGRKFNEAFMSLLLELHYSKDEILEAYANEIYLGQDGDRAIHGFGLASRFFFNRTVADLDLPRIALLVAIIKGPSQ
jgi:penicillin-binding protein 1B